jgi:site-specific recombinase XerD
MRDHRGARSSTVDIYMRAVRELFASCGGKMARLSARRLRRFIVDRASRHGPAHASATVTGCRMFMRFLASDGVCSPDLVAAVPTVVAHRLSRLPRHMPREDVKRLIASCKKSIIGLRDRAVLLLLARLGLRASDVVDLTLDAFDWSAARVRVAGKSRRQEWLPLPQDVGDAVLAYLKVGRPRIVGPALFYNTVIPIRPINRRVVSSTVRRAIGRAGVDAPSRGAHVLRHSAAVAMLEAGSSLHEIAAVLRHASIETTFHYAKVDQALLTPLALPWPTIEVEAGPSDRRVSMADLARLAPPWPGVP